MKRTLTIATNLVGFILFVLGFLLALNAFSYLNFDFGYGFLRLKQKAIATGFYLPAYYSHVLIAGLILVIGFLQVSTRLRKRWPGVHRFLGKIYVFGILFFAAPGGMVMSFFINRGPWVLLSFIIQCSLWFYFTAVAFNKIRKGDIQSHRHFMWRSFALTLAAITLRVYAFAMSSSFDLTQSVAYSTIAWLSWTLNLLIAEIIIQVRFRRIKPSSATQIT